MSKNYEAMRDMWPSNAPPAAIPAADRVIVNGQEYTQAVSAKVNFAVGPPLGERRMSSQELENAFNALADDNRKQFDNMHDRMVIMEQCLVHISTKIDAFRKIERYLEGMGLKLGEMSVDIALAVRALAAKQPAPTVGCGKKTRRR
jgi:hypothetical protein